jgi:hypothetical protein
VLPSCDHRLHLDRPSPADGLAVLSSRCVVCTWEDLSPEIGACESRHLVRSWLAMIGGWRRLFRCWGDSYDSACCSRAASDDGLASSSVEDNVGASCCVYLCIPLLSVCFHSVFVMHKYLLDLFVE